jgi:hypothetical protein
METPRAKSAVMARGGSSGDISSIPRVLLWTQLTRYSLPGTPTRPGEELEFDTPAPTSVRELTPSGEREASGHEHADEEAPPPSAPWSPPSVFPDAPKAPRVSALRLPRENPLPGRPRLP